MKTYFPATGTWEDPYIPPSDHSLSKSTFTFYVCVFCALFAALCYLYSRRSGEISESAIKAEVTVAAQDQIRAQLLAPSTARFPWGATVANYGEGIYYVHSYVDAQNAFGAMLRKNWQCKVYHNGAHVLVESCELN